MKAVQEKYFPKGHFDFWMDRYYQLGNRLTFLKMLNENGFGHIDSVKLVLLNFVNDEKYRPTTEDEWVEHYKSVWFDMTGKEMHPQDVIVVNFDVN